MRTRILSAVMALLALAASAPGQEDLRARLDGPFDPPEWLATVKVSFSDAQLTETNQFGLTIWNRLAECEGDPSRFREAIATVHRTLDLNDKPAFKAACCQALGIWYEAMLQDDVRAYQWYRSLGTLAAAVPMIHDPQNHNPRDTRRYANLGMARCCVRLGLAEEADRLLAPHVFEDWRELLDLAVIYRMMGDAPKSDAAVAAAVSSARTVWDRLAAAGRGTILFYANGNLGEIEKRLPGYTAAYDRLFKQEGGKLPVNLTGQNALVEIIRKDPVRPGPLSLAGLRDGTYKGEGPGFHQPIAVQVRLDRGRITEVRVTETREKRCFNAAAVVSDGIVKKQSLDVDGITGATVTSLCIENAVRDALKKAQP